MLEFAASGSRPVFGARAFKNETMGTSPCGTRPAVQDEFPRFDYSARLTFEDESSDARIQHAAPIRTMTGSSGQTNLQQQYRVFGDGRFLFNVRVDDLSSAPITPILNWKPALEQ